jgi:hypothetical protein
MWIASHAQGVDTCIVIPGESSIEADERCGCLRGIWNCAGDKQGVRDGGVCNESTVADGIASIICVLVATTGNRGIGQDAGHRGGSVVAGQ